MFNEIPSFIMGIPVFRFPSEELTEFHRNNQITEESTVTSFKRDILSRFVYLEPKKAVVKSYVNDASYIVAYPDEKIFVEKQVVAGQLTPADVIQWGFSDPLPVNVSNIAPGYLHHNTIEHFDFAGSEYVTRDAFVYEHKDEGGYHFTSKVYLKDESEPAFICDMHVVLDDYFNVTDANLSLSSNGEPYGVWNNPNKPKAARMKP